MVGREGLYSLHGGASLGTDALQKNPTQGSKSPGLSPLAGGLGIPAGELDTDTSPTEARMVAADFPDSRLRIVRNGGHVPSLYGGRYPTRDWVRRFLSRR